MPEPLDTSASQALASRAKMEYRATHVVARQTDEFFTTVHSLAMRDREYLSAGAVHALWEELVRPEALALPADLAASLGTLLLESSVPNNTYTSAMAVLATAAEEAWSEKDVSEGLYYTLHPATASIERAANPGPSLTAASPVREVIMDLPGKGFRQAIRTPLRKNFATKFKIALRNVLNEYGYIWGAVVFEAITTKVTEFKAKQQEKAMAEEGLPTKMWVTRRDDRVRDAHREADYQTVPVGQPFIVGGFAMMFPGDSAAPIYLTANCRCVIVPGSVS